MPEHWLSSGDGTDVGIIRLILTEILDENDAGFTAPLPICLGEYLHCQQEHDSDANATAATSSGLENYNASHLFRALVILPVSLFRYKQQVWIAGTSWLKITEDYFWATVLNCRFREFQKRNKRAIKCWPTGNPPSSSGTSLVTIQHEEKVGIDAFLLKIFMAFCGWLTDCSFLSTESCGLFAHW